jgi:hypothetical protein
MKNIGALTPSLASLALADFERASFAFCFMGKGMQNDEENHSTQNRKLLEVSAVKICKGISEQNMVAKSKFNSDDQFKIKTTQHSSGNVTSSNHVY